MPVYFKNSNKSSITPKWREMGTFFTTMLNSTEELWGISVQAPMISYRYHDWCSVHCSSNIQSIAEMAGFFRVISICQCNRNVAKTKKKHKQRRNTHRLSPPNRLPQPTIDGQFYRTCDTWLDQQDVFLIGCIAAELFRKTSAMPRKVFLYGHNNS
jgi:hypothetical protein